MENQMPRCDKWLYEQQLTVAKALLSERFRGPKGQRFHR